MKPKTLKALETSLLNNHVPVNRQARFIVPLGNALEWTQKMLLLISPFSLRLNVDLKEKGLPSRFYITCPYQFLLGEPSLTGLYGEDSQFCLSKTSCASKIPLPNRSRSPTLDGRLEILKLRANPKRKIRKEGGVNRIEQVYWLIHSDKDRNTRLCVCDNLP